MKARSLSGRRLTHTRQRLHEPANYYEALKSYNNLFHVCVITAFVVSVYEILDQNYNENTATGYHIHSFIKPENEILVVVDHQNES